MHTWHDLAHLKSSRAKEIKSELQWTASNGGEELQYTVHIDWYAGLRATKQRGMKSNLIHYYLLLNTIEPRAIKVQEYNNNNKTTNKKKNGRQTHTFCKRGSKKI